MIVGNIGVPGVTERVFDPAAVLGPLEAVVDNAAVNHDCTVVNMTDHEWREVLTVSLDATFSQCRTAVRHNWQAVDRGGRKVNTASAADLYDNGGRPTTRRRWPAS